MHASILTMARGPGMPKASDEIAKRFQEALRWYMESEDLDQTAIQRRAAGRGHDLNRITWHNQVHGKNSPSMDMQLAIAALIGVSPYAIADGSWVPGMAISPTPRTWREVITDAATTDGYTLDDVEQFFREYPERGRMMVRDALAIIAAHTGKAPLGVLRHRDPKDHPEAKKRK